MRLNCQSVGRVVIIAVMLLSGGCSILPKTAPSDIYRLPTTALKANKMTPVPWSLRIVRPKASETLDSPRIAVIPQGDVISSYKGARWSDPAPVLLRNRLTDAFYRDGRVQSISTDDSNLLADFELGGELQAFQSEYNGQAIDVVIRMDARIANDRQRIVASRRFEVRQSVADKQVAAVVAAFGQASDTLTAQLLQWTLEQGQHNYATAPKNQ
ncbi:ABC-type transport auxiliary lipoprotein family protein [Pseudomonas huanghezhanensis]|uniref:ABC-type transport auxiliary lipoprotein family protein n=1 Tax=Pseudomonas huanghezhanensis TaxID=3002903 RepID=UPI002285DA80|nr:ABC-type transport auxiliary lipoprotein family protein [Pseudomonas sp. BSw22131]